MNRLVFRLVFRLVLVLVLDLAIGACSPPRASGVADVAVAPVAAPPSNAPAPPPSKESVTRFDLGFDSSHVCVRVDSRVRCAFAFGGLADAEPIALDAIDLAVGDGFQCIVRSSGVVSCWGANDWGQLGAGLAEERSEAPVDVRGISNARRVAASSFHACALLESGGVSCWGDNKMGATGGSVAYATRVHELVEPDAVPVVASAIATSRNASYAIVRSGGIAVWGESPFDNVNDERPRVVAGVTGVESLVAGEDAICELRMGEVACAGNSWSLFGDYRGRTAEPIPIHTHGRVRRVRIAPRHGCALLVDGRVECWGSNSEGALGRRDENDSSKTYGPEVVDDLPDAIDVFAGGEGSCALTDTRELYCWGSGSSAPAPIRL